MFNCTVHNGREQVRPQKLNENFPLYDIMHTACTCDK